MRLLYWLCSTSLGLLCLACQQSTPPPEPPVATTLETVQEKPLTASQQQDQQTIESIQAYVQQKNMEQGQWISTTIEPAIGWVKDVDETGQLVRQTVTIDQATVEVYWCPNASGEREVCFAQYALPLKYYSFYNLSPTGYKSKVIVMDQEGTVLMGGEEGDLLRKYEQVVQFLQQANPQD